ncbi:cytochrome c biogenesis protein ResB [Geobacter sp. DSM 9736]|uniref:cytochrome c biogenesis protein ResB n=1 Tax=Geobacter sp. DSM 9736 TaxID=1277350 RepID=UPI000B5067C3|nr:cytochrome c biogenesis protein ResB [Geobacter sp. DSM 9736]SNB45525.1 cytochrome c biogenesis protein [Geobacter sp. DSM 9736]
MTINEKTVSRALWDFFCSLKLTMFLLITLAGISIIGTVIPQGAPPPEYLQTISQNKLKLYEALGFFDMYHSWWFILLLCMLSVNLTACSVKRLPHIWKTITEPVLVMDEKFEKTLSNVTAIPINGDARKLMEGLGAVLKNEFAQPVITEVGETFHLFAEKAPWSRLAVYVVHLSVLVTFVGAIIGSLFGYKGFVNIPEGESAGKVMSRADKEIDLGFAVRCEKFSVAHYPNGAPKEFKSILTVLENGQPVPGFDRVPVIVNDPLTYKGITFYQSSYGKLGEHFFTISEPDGSKTQTLTIKSGGSAKLPGGNIICLQEATEDISQFMPALTGPAAQVEVHLPNGETQSFIVFGNNPAMNRMNLSYTGGKLLQYRGGEEFMYTGLQVAKDPGVWVVWLGCTLMIAGVYSAFFMSHRRIWVRIENGIVTVGGNASKNQGGFQIFMERLVTKIKKQLTSEDGK